MITHNKKSEQRMNKVNRERAQFLVDLYLTWRLSVRHDAGWHGAHVLGRLVDFQGSVPPASGNDQADYKMLDEIRYLAGQFHAETDHAVEVLRRVPRVLFDAVLLDRYARRRVMRECVTVVGRPCKVVEVPYTTDYIAQALAISPDSYRQRVSRGYGCIAVLDEMAKLHKASMANILCAAENTSTAC